MDLSDELSVACAVLDYGDQALLLQCDSTADVLAWTDALRKAALPGVVDIVPASRTVLMKLDGPGFQAVTRHRLRKLRVTPDPVVAAPAGHRCDAVIDVVYDGPDLIDIARHTGLTTAQVINAHTATPWRAGFSGSIPGFTYLIDGDPRLQVPRRFEPRTTVPAGSVTLVGEFSAVYPRQSRSGWHIIGHTDAVMWDLDRPNPALLTQGMWVQFRAV